MKDRASHWATARRNRRRTRPYFCCSLKSYSDSLPRRAARVILKLMKRQLIALIAMLALGLQGSLVALAAAAPPMADCQTPAHSQDVVHKSCCPSGLHTASCCLDACLSAVAVTVTPAPLVYTGHIGNTLAPKGFWAHSTRPDSWSKKPKS